MRYYFYVNEKLQTTYSTDLLQETNVLKLVCIWEPPDGFDEKQTLTYITKYLKTVQSVVDKTLLQLDDNRQTICTTKNTTSGKGAN